MAGPFDWARYVTGDRDNPEEDLGQWSDAQQAQNRAAIGLDANGNPIAQPVAPVGAAPSAGAQGAQASSTLPANQEPNATKTPVSLGHLMMNLQQYNEREQGFNQALGQGFAAFAQPRDRQMVAGMFNVTPANPTVTAQTLMNLSSQGQGQDRANRIGQILSDPNQAAALAAQLHTTPEQLRAAYLADPASIGKMIQTTQVPTPVMADVQQATAWMQQQGWDPQRIKDTQNLILSGVLKNSDLQQMAIDTQTYRQNHGGQDPPWAGSPAAYAQSKKDTAELSASVKDASDRLGSNDPKMAELQNRVAGLKTNAGLKKILDGGPAVKAAAQAALADTSNDWKINAATKGTGLLTPDMISAIDEVKQINGQEYGAVIHNMPGSRFSTQEVGAVRAGMGQTQQLDLNSQDYNAQAVDPMIDAIKDLRGAGYGAAQSFRTMPEDLRTHVNSIYLPGGNLNQEGSGAEGWAKDVNKPLPPDAAVQAQALIAKEPRNAPAIRRHLRDQGFVVPF